MNKTYRMVWNNARRSYVPVSESTKLVAQTGGLKKGILACIVTAASALVSGCAFANDLNLDSFGVEQRIVNDAGDKLVVEVGEQWTARANGEWKTVVINGSVTNPVKSMTVTESLAIGGEFINTNEGRLVASGESGQVKTIVSGNLKNQGWASFDDIEITDKGNLINELEVYGSRLNISAGGVLSNSGVVFFDGMSVSGNVVNSNEIRVGSIDDSDQDFHINIGGSFVNAGVISAVGAGGSSVQGNFINEKKGQTRFDGLLIGEGGNVTNHGTESGFKLTIGEGGSYANDGTADWDEALIKGDFTNTGTMDIDVATLSGGRILAVEGVTDLGTLKLESGDIVVGNDKELSEDNKALAKWESPTALNVGLWVVGNGELTIGAEADKLGETVSAPKLPEAAARLTMTNRVVLTTGTIAVGTDVYKDKTDHAELSAGSMHFGKDSYTLVDSKILNADSALFETATEGATLTIKEGATLALGNISNPGEYLIAEGFDMSANLDERGNWIGGWTGDNLVILPQEGSGLGWDLTMHWDEATDKFWVTAALEGTVSKYPTLAIPTIADAAMNVKDPESMDTLFIQGVMKDKDASEAVKSATLNSVAQLGLASGTMTTTYDAAMDALDVVDERLSFAGEAFNKIGDLTTGRHGTSLWVKAVGTRSETKDLKASGNLEGGVEVDRTGFFVGADYANPYQTAVYGASFGYTKSSLDSTGDWLASEADADSYSATLYMTWTPNRFFNFTAQAGYLMGSSDASQTIGLAGFKSAQADIDSQAAYASLRAEYRIRWGKNFIVVPHVGARGIFAFSDEYETKIDGKTAFNNEFQETKTWQVPFGISVRGERVTAGGWALRAAGDLTGAIQFGDVEQETEVRSLAGTMDTVTGEFVGDWQGKARLGLEVAKGGASLSVNYAFAMGQNLESHQVNASLRWTF